jgi:hypothetical protein
MIINSNMAAAAGHLGQCSQAHCIGRFGLQTLTS